MSAGLLLSHPVIRPVALGLALGLLLPFAAKASDLPLFLSPTVEGALPAERSLLRLEPPPPRSKPALPPADERSLAGSPAASGPRPVQVAQAAPGRSRELVTSGHAADFAALTPADWLGLSPALDLQARGPLGVQADLALRGTGAGQTLLQLDGQPLQDPQTAHHDLDLPVAGAELAGVEIAPGPHSARFGSDAFGGVVNLVTRPPGEGAARVLAWGGDFGTVGASAWVPWSALGWGHALSAERTHTSGFRPGTAADLAQTAYSAAWRGSGLEARGRLGFIDKRFGAADFYGPYPSWEHTRLAYGAGSARIELGPELEAEPAFSFRRHEDTFLLNLSPSLPLENRHLSLAADLALPAVWRTSGGGQVRLGLEARPESLDSSALGQRSRLRGGAYAEVRSAESTAWAYDFGLRLDAAGAGPVEWSPAVGLTWRWDPEWRAHAAVGRAFRVPNFTELYYSSPGNQGDPGLRPESAWSGEVGLEGRPASPFAVRAAAFAWDERNGIDWVRASGADPWRAANLRRVLACGTRLGVAWEGPDARLAFDYAFQTLRTDPPNGFQSKYLLNYPVHRLDASGVWRPVPGWSLALRASFRRPLDAAGYWLVEGAVRYAWSRGWEAFVRTTNALNSTYTEIPGVPLPGRWLGGGVSVSLE